MATTRKPREAAPTAAPAADPLTEARTKLKGTASAVTRAAIKIVGERDLYHLLDLDGISAERVAAFRAHVKVRASALAARAQRCDDLARLAERFRAQSLAAMAADSDPWARALRFRATTRQHVVASVEELTNIVGRAAERVAAHARADRKWELKARPRADDKGSRSATAAIRKRLVELHTRLSRADSSRWTVAEVARLILASEDDWIDPPCPDLAKNYRPRTGEARKASRLEAWIWTHLSRGRPAEGARAAKRKRAKRTAPRSASV